MGRCPTEELIVKESVEGRNDRADSLCRRPHRQSRPTPAAAGSSGSAGSTSRRLDAAAAGSSPTAGGRRWETVCYECKRGRFKACHYRYLFRLVSIPIPHAVVVLHMSSETLVPTWLRDLYAQDADRPQPLPSSLGRSRLCSSRRTIAPARRRFLNVVPRSQAFFVGYSGTIAYPLCPLESMRFSPHTSGIHNRNRL